MEADRVEKPGRVEFRVSADGQVYFGLEKGGEKRLTRFSKSVCDHLSRLISMRFPGAWARLCILYNHQGGANEKTRFKCIERFVRCNFGEHDFLSFDIDHDVLNFEEVRCPLRGGFCPDENIVCKPQGLVGLSPSEREVARHYLEGYTFREIAETLGKSPQTVKAQLRSIKAKLNVRNCREIIKVLRAQCERI